MMEKSPNILWIMTDQQSFNMLSCAGNPYVHTPNLDALAARAVRFENAYCTNPVCLPSRFSLFTGLYPGEIGIRSNIYPRESRELPQTLVDNGLGHLLREEGYEVCYGGKEHFPFVDVDALGLTSFTHDERHVLAEKSAQILRQHDWEKPLFMVSSFINPHDICYMAICDAMGDEEADALTRNAYIQVSEMEKAQKLPADMGEAEFFQTLCPPLPENYLPSADEPEAIAILQQDRPFKKLAREHYSDERWRIHRWAYAQLTQLVDSQIGQVLDALQESGHWDDTLIIFTSDHGDMDASHKMEHKENLYQEACHVPLIIKAPNQQQGRLADQLVCNGLDLIATVMDYAGTRVPYYIGGKSLRPCVEHGCTEELRDALVIECENGIGAVSKDFKYVLYDKGQRNEQLYDLRRDPGETRSCLEDADYAQAVEMFRKLIAKHLRSYREEFIRMKL